MNILHKTNLVWLKRADVFRTATNYADTSVGNISLFLLRSKTIHKKKKLSLRMKFYHYCISLKTKLFDKREGFYKLFFYNTIVFLRIGYCIIKKSNKSIGNLYLLQYFFRNYFYQYKQQLLLLMFSTPIVLRAPNVYTSYQ